MPPSEHAALWGELERRLGAVLARLAPVLEEDARDDALELVEHNEFGVAWELVCDVLVARRLPVEPDVAAELALIGRLMGLAGDERVARVRALGVRSP